MVKRFFIHLLFFGLLFLISGKANAVSAQVLKFELDPAQLMVKGSPFQVKILINTAGIETTNADAMIIFDPTKLSVNTSQFQDGSFYPTYSQNLLEGSSTKYLVSGFVKDISSKKAASVDTLFATVSFTPLDVGATQLSFDCTAGSTADSNITRASDTKDIIQCPLQALGITVTDSGDTTTTPPPGGSPQLSVTPTPSYTPTPTPTSTPTSTPVPTVSELPRTGSTEITFTAVGIGVVLTVVGVLLLL